MCADLGVPKKRSAATRRYLQVSPSMGMALPLSGTANYAVASYWSEDRQTWKQSPRESKSSGFGFDFPLSYIAHLET